jgi:hypothetical protein
MDDRYFDSENEPSLQPELSLSSHHFLEFQQQVLRGRRIAREKRAVICGLARDLEWILPKTLQRLQRLGEMFADYRIVIYENDSKDRSRLILEHFQKQNSRVHLLSDSLGDPPNQSIRCLRRADRMAKYRNRYREYVAEKFADFDFTIVADLDLPGGWSENGIAHTFGHSEWDFVGSNGLIKKKYLVGEKLLQFDAWALRKDGSYEALTTREVNYLRWKLDLGLIPVYSCFGGLGIYRMPAMLSCADAGGDCEHVPLHREMRNQGMTKLFLNPFQVTDYHVKYSRARRWANHLERFWQHLNGSIRSNQKSRARTDAYVELDLHPSRMSGVSIGDD